MAKAKKTKKQEFRYAVAQCPITYADGTQTDVYVASWHATLGEAHNAAVKATREDDDHYPSLVLKVVGIAEQPALLPPVYRDLE